MNIKGIELEFDITSPADILRYKQAGEAMEQKGAEMDWPKLEENDPNYLEAYVEMLNIELRLYGDFIDDIFGDDTANKLLGRNPSLTRVTEIIDEMSEAFTLQGKEIGVKFRKYSPNRATRRGKK